MTRLLLILAVAAFVAVALAAPVPVAAKKPVLYYPVTKGTKWVYRPRCTKEFTILLDAVEVKDGATIISLVELGEGGKKTPVEKFSLSAKGAFRVETRGQKVEPPSCELPLPFKAGVRWETKAGEAPLDIRVKYTTVGPSVVSVPAGKFSAVGVESEMRVGGDEKPLKRTDWYAPGVGHIKSEDPDGVLMELLSFTPGKN